MTQLRTERLILRRPELSDAAALVAAVNHWDVARWVSEIPYPYTADHADAFLKDAIQSDDRVWFIFEQDVLCGCVALYHQFGYWLTPSAWGRGIGTEAARAVLDWHFKSNDGDVDAKYLRGNEGSARILSKLGFHEIGASTCSSRAAGENLPSISMRLTKAEWEANR